MIYRNPLLSISDSLHAVQIVFLLVSVRLQCNDFPELDYVLRENRQSARAVRFELLNIFKCAACNARHLDIFNNNTKPVPRGLI